MIIKYNEIEYTLGCDTPLALYRNWACFCETIYAESLEGHFVYEGCEIPIYCPMLFDGREVSEVEVSDEHTFDMLCEFIGQM